MGYLIYKGKKAATIKSYVSAIKSVLWEDGRVVNEDRTQITALTRACRWINNQICLRLPIQKRLLNNLLGLLEDHFLGKNQPYLATMYKALFVSAYYGLLHISELTKGDHIIGVMDVHLASNKNKLLFILRSSKMHSTDAQPQLVKISSEPINAGSQREV